MLYLVYKSTNLVNGKHYIGAHQTEILACSSLAQSGQLIIGR